MLDSSGRALAILPDNLADIGRAVRHPVRAARDRAPRHVAVSNVVASAVASAPVVAFAVPFDTPFGRRVFSGAYLVSNTPLAAFLNDTTTLKGARLYLTDGTDVVFASNGYSGTRLAESDGARSPRWARPRPRTAQATTRRLDAATRSLRLPMPGTPWSLFIAAPTSQRLRRVNGTGHWLPWLILGGLSLLIALAAWLAIRLLAGRRRLADMNRQLAIRARTDKLTGLTNRAHLTEELEQLLDRRPTAGLPRVRADDRHRPLQEVSTTRSVIAPETSPFAMSHIA